MKVTYFTSSDVFWCPTRNGTRHTQPKRLTKFCPNISNRMPISIFLKLTFPMLTRCPQVHRLSVHRAHCVPLDRYFSTMSSPLLMSTHLPHMGLRCVRVRQCDKDTGSHTPILINASISFIRASITFLYFRILPMRSSCTISASKLSSFVCSASMASAHDFRYFAVSSYSISALSYSSNSSRSASAMSSVALSHITSMMR